MKLILVFSQLFVLFTWLIANKNYFATVKQITSYKFSIQGILINAWLILFVIQILSNDIFKIGSGDNQPLQYLGLLIYMAGVYLAIWARLSLGRSWGLPMQHDIKSQKELIIKGAYKYSRNPIYLSELVMLLGFEMVLQSWLVFLIIPFIIFNYMKIISEEKRLKEFFKADYIDYMNKVPRFFWRF